MAAFKALSIKSSSLFSGYTHCVRPALSAVGELGDVDTGPGAQRLQERPAGGLTAPKIGLGNERHEVHDGGSRTGGPTGDSLNLPGVDAGDDDGVDFHRKSGFCGLGHALLLSGEKGCHGSGIRAAAHRPVDVPGTDDGAGIDSDRQGGNPAVQQFGQSIRQNQPVGAQAEQESGKAGVNQAEGLQGGGARSTRSRAASGEMTSEVTPGRDSLAQS